MKALLKSTLQAFPGKPIQFLGANAGVIFAGSTVLTGSVEEWKFTYDVNVLGVAKTLQTFVAHMAKSTSKDKPCIVEITGSSAGIMFGSVGPYGTSKQAAVGLAEELYKEISNSLPKVKVGLVHGRLKKDQKDSVIEKFRNGDIQLLVCTTVIEVGVDVPEATLMIIENTERLG